MPLADGNVDLRRELVHRSGAVTTLTTREAALLAFLAARPGEAVPREVLQTQVWGYHPTVMSRAIDTTVRRLRTKIETDPSRPVHLLTVHGVGYRFEPARGGEVAASPVAVADTGVVGAPDVFVGRAGLQKQLDEALARWPVVTLVGPAGIGKSRLAHHMARRRADEGGGVWVLDAAELTSAAQLCQAVAHRLGVRLPAGDPVSAVGNLLAAHPGLWLIDDADRGVAAVAEAVARWLVDVPMIRFCVTTRERLRIDGEGVIEVPALRVDEAAALFRVRAVAADPAFCTSDADLAPTLEALAGNPLAIELAAARVHSLGVEGLAARLQQPLQALGPELRGRPKRRASLRGALDVSWELLTPPERAVLTQLTVFRGGFTGDLADAVVQTEPGSWPTDVLARLVERSLVQVLHVGGGARFALSAPVREHAVEHLDSSVAVTARHVAATLALGSRLVDGLDSPAAVGCLRRLALERANLAAALTAAVDPGDIALLTEIVDALLDGRGGAGERLALLDEGVTRSRLAPATRRAPLLRRRGDARRVSGRVAAAHVDLQQAVELAVEAELPVVEAQARCSLAALAWMEGELEGAADLAGQASQQAAAEGAEPVEVRALIIAGGVARRRGDAVAADTHLLAALARARRLGLPEPQALALHHLSSLRREEGRLDDATALLAEACAVYRALGHLRREAVGRHDLGGLLALRGELISAQTEVREALALARRGGEAIVTAHILHTLGHLLHRQGALGEAERLYLDAVELLRGLDPVLAASARGDLAALQADRGQIDSAAHALAEVAEEIDSSDDPAVAWVLELHRGHVDAARARAATSPSEAAHHLEQARFRLELGEGADGPARDRCRMSVQLLAQTLERVL